MDAWAPKLLLCFLQAEELRLNSLEGAPETVIGFSADDLLSNHVSFFDRVHPDDKDLLSKLKKIPGESSPGTVCLRIRHADGRIRCVQTDYHWDQVSPIPSLTLQLQSARAATRLKPFDKEGPCLGLMIENTGEGIFFKDQNHAFRAASPEFRNRIATFLKGRDVDGLTDYDFLPETDADKFYAAEKQVLSSGLPLEKLTEAQQPSGEHWILSRYVPVKTPDGVICGIYVSTKDITHGLHAEERLESLNYSLEVRTPAQMGSYILDAQRGVFATSSNTELLLGIGRDYPHTLADWKSLIHPDDRERVLDYFHTVLATPGRIFSKEYRIIRQSDGELRWIHAIGRVIRNTETGEPMLLSGTVQDITERKHTEGALRETRDRLQLFIEHAPAALAMFDRDMRYLAVSRRWLEDEKQSREIIGRCHYDIVRDLPEHFKEAHRRGLAGETTHCDEDRVEWPDGSVQWLRWEVVPWREVNGVVGGIMLFIDDLTEFKKSEERLQLAASVFEHASEAILVMDLQTRVLEVNDAFTHITGFTREEIVGNKPTFLRSPRQDAAFYADLWKDLQETGRWSGEMWCQGKDGRQFAAISTLTTVHDSEGKPQYYIGLISDITSIKENERMLEHMARYDALTGLANRFQLTEHLRRAMIAAREGNRVLAVIYIDLDDFKDVNDRIGREASDILLIQLASQMKQALREGDLLGRIGGDEFVAILPDLPIADAATPVIERLLRAAAEPYRVGDHVIQLSATAGTAFYPQAQEVDADQLLRQADQVMYEAKLSTKGHYQIFDPVRDSSVRGRSEELHRIRQALKASEFRLYYQPKVNMASGTLVGAEALIRWQHPERGLLAPALFLPAIEDHDLAIEVGEWVIDTALRQVEAWAATGHRIPVSVNISARHLQQLNFMERLRMLLLKHSHVDCSCLELELLETSALNDMRHVSRVIEECRELGISIAIDDFGTGYSSLTYLKRLSANVLKIDQSFVRDMLDDPDDLAIMQGVLGLATAFRRTPIAEGVETPEHGVLLLKLGCYLAQGYGIARPMPAEELLPWYAQWRPDVRWVSVKPITPLDWSILVAEVSMTAWSRTLEGYLRGAEPEPPELDERNCRLGHWLEMERHGPRADSPHLLELDTLHRERHRLAREAVKLHDAGKKAKAHELAQACILTTEHIQQHLTALCSTTEVRAGLTGLCPWPRTPALGNAKLQ